MYLNLADAPIEPVERLAWLSGVTEVLEAEFAAAYYEARLQRSFEHALALGLHSRKQALAYTRHENERRGRTIRWQDGLDPTSSAYVG